MSDMRRLATLYGLFKEQHKADGKSSLVYKNASDMFQRSNFSVLSEAINVYTTREGGVRIKSGLKMGLYYLLKRSCKIVKSTFLVEGKDDSAAEIDKFTSVLELNHEFIFGDATYQINKSRQIKLRKPASLPIEKDIEQLREYTMNTVAGIIQDKYIIWDSHNFSKLRDLTVSRLTLFNARRGGEPSRLTIDEWKEADNNSWIDKQRAEMLSDPLDKCLLENMKITYQTGKGNHLVPVLFPMDTTDAMRILADMEIRSLAGVRADNLYIFLCVQKSVNHVTGWLALNNICDEAGITRKSQLTATKNRHRISTLYATMEVPEAERSLFSSIMGHSSTINEDIYQPPQAIMEVLKVGEKLQEIDTGNCKNLRTCFRPSAIFK